MFGYRIFGVNLTRIFRPQQLCSKIFVSRTYSTLQCNSRNGRTVISKFSSLENKSSLLYCSSANVQHEIEVIGDADEKKPLTEEELAERTLANLGQEEARKLKILQLEYDVMESTGSKVPVNMTSVMWLKVLQDCPTISKRYSIYRYWFKVEKAQENEMKKKAVRQKIHLEKLAKTAQLVAEGKFEVPNRINFRIRESTMVQSQYANLAYAMQFGLPLVYDFSFDDMMTEIELKHLVKQMLLCHAQNKVLREPFHFYWCNAKPESKFLKMITRSLDIDRVPMTVTEQDYLDIFPKGRLVYLTPNSKDVLRQFSYDDVYIVGGLVDKGTEIPVTHAKVKRQQLRSAKLPIDQHLEWRMGGKALTLDQMNGILTSLKTSPKDWQEAFKAIPSRKIRRY